MRGTTQKDRIAVSCLKNTPTTYYTELQKIWIALQSHIRKEQSVPHVNRSNNHHCDLRRGYARITTRLKTLRTQSCKYSNVEVGPGSYHNLEAVPQPSYRYLTVSIHLLNIMCGVFFVWETAYSVVIVNINFSIAVSKQKPDCSLTKTKVKLTTHIGIICQYSHSNSVMSNKITRIDIILKNIDEYHHKLTITDI